MDVPTHSIVRKATHLEIRDLPADILILIFSLLHGQDIARCVMVCRTFSDLIHADLSLQYRISLAQNGMVDGECSTLSVSERLQRLRQYQANFTSGTFQHEDLTAHPDYVLRNGSELGWPRVVVSAERPSGVLYKKSYQDDSPLYLSTFVPGSAQVGIPSSRSLFTIREAVKPELATVVDWAMDSSQDLLVMAEMTRLSYQQETDGQIPELYIRFYSLSGLKTDTVPTPHPAATLPFIRLHIADFCTPIGVYKLQIVGEYVVLELMVAIGAVRSFFVDVYNWKTGQMISTINVGTVMVSIVPLEKPYLLLFPYFSPETTRMSGRHPNFSIYSFSPSPSPSSSPNSEAVAGRHVCTLELPPVPSGEHITWSQAHTGDRADETTGHFRADPSRSIVVLHICFQPLEGGGGGGDDYATYLLIPRATFAAQIHAAESGRSKLSFEDSDTANPSMIVSVPWADWGPQGCLRLRPRNPRLDWDEVVDLKAFGSRLPVVAFDGPERESASVYVFDVNPLVARSVRATCDHEDVREKDSSEETSHHCLRLGADALPRSAMVSAVVKDIEEMLSGVVDPECAAIPFVVYRFPIPYSGPARLPEIREVTMNVAGFTIEFDGSIEYEQRFQTWSV